MTLNYSNNKDHILLLNNLIIQIKTIKKDQNVLKMKYLVIKKYIKLLYFENIMLILII